MRWLFGTVVLNVVHVVCCALRDQFRGCGVIRILRGGPQDLKKIEMSKEKKRGECPINKTTKKLLFKIVMKINQLGQW